MTMAEMIVDLEAIKSRWEATIKAGWAERQGLNGYPEIELSSELVGREACLDDLSKLLADWEAKGAALEAAGWAVAPADPDAMIAEAQRIKREIREAQKAATIERKERAFRAAGKRRWSETMKEYDQAVADAVVARLTYGTWKEAARQTGIRTIRSKVIRGLQIGEERAERIRALLTAEQWEQINAIIPAPWYARGEDEIAPADHADGFTFVEHKEHKADWLTYGEPCHHPADRRRREGVHGGGAGDKAVATRETCLVCGTVLSGDPC